MKKIFTFIVLAFASQIIFTPGAQAGLLEFLFPSLRTVEEDPSATLQAPFADPQLQAERQVSSGQLPENAVPLDQPHRDHATIREWIMTATSEVMMFSGHDVQADLNRHRRYFDQAGWRDYTAFLNEKGMMKTLQSGQYQLRSFVEDEPLILNEGVVGGRYRWLYEVPVMMSYLGRTVQDYKEAQPINQVYTLNIQVGRSKDASSEHGLLIEGWTNKGQKSSR